MKSVSANKDDITKERKIDIEKECLYPEPNAKSLMALKEAEEMMQSNFICYKSADEMFKAMGL